MKPAKIQPSPSVQNVPSQVMEQPEDGTTLYAVLIGTGGGYSDELIANLIAAD